MEIALKVVVGAAAGAAAGFLLGRVRACSASACGVKANLAYSILAGAFLGAVAAWVLATR